MYTPDKEATQHEGTHNEGETHQDHHRRSKCSVEAWNSGIQGWEAVCTHAGYEQSCSALRREALWIFLACDGRMDQSLDSNQSEQQIGAHNDHHYLYP